jgi:phosphotransferase system HPr (HPr) family protein
MGILMLGAEQGTEIIIEADGKDAQEVLVELEKVVNCEEEL